MSLNVYELAIRLSRSVNSIRTRAQRIGIAPRIKTQRIKWTAEKIETLRRDYSRVGSSRLASEFGISQIAVIHKAAAIGIRMKHDDWCKRNKESWNDQRRSQWGSRVANDYATGRRDRNECRSFLGRAHTESHRIAMAAKHKGKRFSLGQKRSPAQAANILEGKRRARQLRAQSELRQLGQYLTTNAQRLIMEGNEKNGITAGNEDVMQSSDGSWLLAELQKSFDTSVKHIVRMAAIVRRLDELGVAIEMESSVLPYLRKIAHGNLSPDLFVTMQGHKSMLNIASTLPAPVQQQIAKNEPIKVMQTNGDFRMVPPLSMTTKEVSQVFAFGRIRDEAEQVGYLRGKMQEKATTDHVCEEDAVKIDRKRRGIVVGKTFISFIELEHFYKALAPKKKSRQVV